MLKKGDRIILIGNTLAERMQYFGHFETLLHGRFPELELVVHNLGYSADELTLRPRQAHFNDHGHTLKDEKPDVLIAAFGFNESFAGPAGLTKFKTDLESFIKSLDDHQVQRQGAAPAGPALADRPGGPQEPAHHRRQAEQRRTSSSTPDAMAELAGKHGVVFVDLFTPTQTLYRGERAAADDQRHPPERRGLPAAGPAARRGPVRPRPSRDKADLKALYAAVQEKNLQFFYDYRAVNGCYIYGGRKAPFGVVNFPAEFAKLRKMIQNRERRIWDLAQGKSVPATIDDSSTGEFATVEDQRQEPDPDHDARRGKQDASRFRRATRSTCLPRRSSFPTWKTRFR